MVNKRGFLLGEFTLKVLIAILCILILMFLLYKIYATFTGQAYLDQANSTVSKIVEEINYAYLNPSIGGNYIMTSPKGWVLEYYSGNEQKPKLCNGDCLCVCEKVGWIGNQVSKCDSNGKCAKVDLKISGLKEIVIDKPVQIIISKNEGGVGFSYG